jgi:hypothetical protein
VRPPAVRDRAGGRRSAALPGQRCFDLPHPRTGMADDTHPDHEELLHVLEGQLRVETPVGEFDVGAGEVLFVPANHPQKAVAVGDDPASVIAVGAPKDSDGATIAERCDACGERTDREFETADEEGTTVYVLSCAGCGAETDRLQPGPPA